MNRRVLRGRSLRYHGKRAATGISSLVTPNQEERGVHITIYESSWDDIADIQDCTGDRVDVGPYCLHTTAGNERWFRQYENGAWEWVTDCGTPSQRYLLAFNAMMNTLGPYLG